MGPCYPLCDIMASMATFYIHSYMLVVKSSWFSSDLRRAEEKQPMRATKAQSYNYCPKNLDWGAGLLKLGSSGRSGGVNTKIFSDLERPTSISSRASLRRKKTQYLYNTANVITSL